MDLTWLIGVGVLFLVVGLCALAYDTVRRRQDSTPFPYPDAATNLLDDTAIQRMAPPSDPTAADATATPRVAPPTATVSSGEPAPESQAPQARSVPGVRHLLRRLPRIAPRFTQASAVRSVSPGYLLSRIVTAVPRRALVALVVASAALIVLSIAILTGGSGEAQRPAGAVVAGVAPFAGDAGADLAGSLTGYLVRGAGAAGVQSLVIRKGTRPVSNAQDAEVERTRIAVDFLVWGDYGASGSITVGIALSPDFAPTVQPWQTYADPDVGALAFPQQAVVYLPAGKGVDPAVPLALALVHLKSGNYEAAANAAWGAQATIDENGGAGESARLIEAAARLAMADYTGAAAAVDVIERTGEPQPEALLVRALARLYLGDYTGALADATRVTGERDAPNRTLARAYLVRARCRYSAGDLAAALADLDESARLDPANLRVRLDRAEVYYRQAQPSASAAQLDALLRVDAGAAPAYRLLGLTKLMLAQPADALGPLAKARSLYDNWTSALRAEEAQAESVGDTPRAHAASDGIVTLNRAKADIALYEGMSYADIARAEPPESFLGGLWRGLRGEPTTWERAITKMQEAARLDPRRPDIPLQLGSVYLRMGDRAQAAAYMQQARDLDPGAPEPYMALAKLSEQSGDLRGAITVLEGLVANTPRYYPAYEEMHRLEVALGDGAAAEATLRRAVALEPLTASDQLWRGKFLVTLGDLVAAEGALQAAAADPELWDAHLQLGLLYLQAGRPPDALAQFQAVLEKQPNNETALLNAGRLLVLAGQTDDAQRMFERLGAVAPNNAGGHMALLELLLTRGDTERAVAEGQKAVAADPKSAATHFALAQAYEARAEWPSASTEYRAAVERDPAHFQAQLNLSATLFREDRYAESLGEADKAATMRPDDPQPHAAQAAAHLALLEPDAALAALGRGLQIKPDDAAALALTARAYLLKGDVGSAIGYARRAMAASPQNSAGALALGDVLVAGGRAEEAVQAYGTALELAGGNVETQALALTGRGRAYALVGDKGKALQAYSEASGKAPRLADPHLYAGLALTELSRWDEALREYRSAVQLRPNWPSALYYLGKAYLQRKDLQNAHAAFAKAVQFGPNMPDAWFGLGLATRDRGDGKSAIEAFRNAVALNGNYADAWLYLGLALEESGDRGGATQAFARARDTTTDSAVRQQAEEGLARVQ